MKKLLYLALIVLVNSLQAQSKDVSLVKDIQRANQVFPNGGFWVSNSAKDEIEGTPYLFNTWDNLSTLYTEDAVYSLNSFNYNIQLERFEAKFSEDSILIINTGNIKKIIINNIELKPYYDNEYRKIIFFEEIAKVDKVVLLKKNLVRVQKGSLNPMTQKKIKPDSYIVEEEFYVKNMDEVDLKPIKLKKSEILKLIKSDYQTKIILYAKEHGLKYYKLSDVHKILQYYNSL
tara:strand:+ start:8029 stop:8724 length:696 start_codon:yes stop_codon:yes gene_type:complete